MKTNQKKEKKKKKAKHKEKNPGNKNYFKAALEPLFLSLLPP